MPLCATMIDLSHLTDEEQERIMAVLKRDTEFKKQEAARIRKLQKVVDRDKHPETKLKYLTGEWFYEVKSHRHEDRIHGSEIILASMKQRKAATLDGYVKASPSSRREHSDASTHSKPGRHVETALPPETSVLEAVKEKLRAAVHPPRRPRRNPFNRTSLILVEPPEKTEDLTADVDRGHQESTETETIAPLTDHTAGQLTQSSGGSVTSEGPPAGFRPVPKKRTFASRKNVAKGNGPGHDLQADPKVNGPGHDLQADPEVTVPAPSLQQASEDVVGKRSRTGSAAESRAHETEAPASRVSPTARPESRLGEVSSEVEPSTADVDVPSVPKASAVTRAGNVGPAGIAGKSGEGIDLNQTEYGPSHTSGQSTKETIGPERRNISDHGSGSRDEEISLTRGVVYPPVRYDLKFIEKAYLHTPTKSSQKPKLSNQILTPAEGDEDTIAKVLEWFDRSTDSSDWLDSEDSQQTVLNTIVGKGDIGGSHENKLRNDKECQATDVKRDLESKENESKEANKDSMGRIKLWPTESIKLWPTERKGEVRGMQGDVKKDREAEALNIMANEDENQQAHVNNFKSFWEKSNPGPRIVLSGSNSAGDEGQKAVRVSEDAERRKKMNENNRMNMFNMRSVSERGKSNANASNAKADNDQAPTAFRHGDTGLIEGIEHNIQTRDIVLKRADYTTKRVSSNDLAPEMSPSLPYLRNESSARNTRKEGPSYSAEQVTSPTNPQVLDRLGSDPEMLSLTMRSTPRIQYIGPAMYSPPRLSPQLDGCTQSREIPSPVTSSSSTSPQQGGFSRAGPGPHLETSPQQGGFSRAGPGPHLETSPQQGGFSRAGPCPHLETNPQSKDNSEEDTSEPLTRCPFAFHQSRGNDELSTPTPEMQRQASEDAKRNAQDDGVLQKSTAPRKESTNVDGNQNSPGPIREASRHPASTAERIRRVKSFWEKEKHRQVSHKGKTKDLGNSGRFTKRFTKSEYDIRFIGSDEDNLVGDANGNGAQFNNLREFWREPTFGRNESFTVDKKKKKKKKEPVESRPPGSQMEQSVDADVYRKPTAVNVERSSSRAAVVLLNSPPTPQNRSGQQKDGRRSVKESREDPTPQNRSAQQKDGRSSAKESREEKTSKLQSDTKAKKDSFGNISSHGGDRPKSSQEGGTRKSATLTRPAVDSESQAPRARAFVPRDYRHYLGTTETSVDNAPAPVVDKQVAEGKSGDDRDFSGPVSASTPIGSEERHGKRGSKMSQRPLWANRSSSDTGRDSSISSPSETQCNSVTSSNWENEDDLSLVKRALRRAETRPKNMAKSLEDLTAYMTPPRQDRRPGPDLRPRNNVTTIPSPCTSSFSDPDHLKKRSRSVPSFLQKELSGSVMTISSGDFWSVEVQGNIQFSINYVQKLREFHVFVAQCHDLAAVDPKRGRSDPYVKTYLVPDKANLGKRKTSVKKKMLSPTFNEILRYRVRMDYLKSQTLILSVWHHDTFGKNSFLGEVAVDLSAWDFDHTQMNYIALKTRTTPSTRPAEDRGEMRLAICFVPQVAHGAEGVSKEGPRTGEVHVWVKDCTNLPPIRATVDSYVKCFVLPDTSRKSRQKTRVVRRTANPSFNHTMVYDGIRQEDLTEACVELTVWDRDRRARSLLGGLRLGLGTGRSYGAAVDWMDSRPYEVALWERMMSRPNEWVEEVLPLRMLTSAAETALL